MPDANSQPSTILELHDWLCAMLAVSPKVLPHAAARLATRIALHLNMKTGRCDASHKTLARETGISERSIYRLVELLEQLGWLVVERATGRANQFLLRTPANSMAEVTPANSMAEVDPEPLPKSAPTTAKIDADHCQQVADRTTRTAKRTLVADTNVSATGERERSRSLAVIPGAPAPHGGAPEVFDALLTIWSVRPHGIDQAAAWKVFVGIYPSGVSAEIIASALRWVSAYRHDPGMLQPLEKWLRNGAWKKEPPKRTERGGSGKVAVARRMMDQE
ncbi:helix-turn-helix domain-containing protein [Bradyrhizobium sp. IC3123]|uniref:helix-turn-helix domain-containing protein n=1 Tax=Bradyrhizobium sp. IC3123 TaxID=2793803 RepID=UPI001CD5B827|nr:helix-turn-helix domain-containing protein [Bradyrhizobium sp. IC3123]MCA1390768.1 helix-turn-helix domain-containing protein [Bradyrhizobium sp. IC3123]